MSYGRVAAEILAYAICYEAVTSAVMYLLIAIPVVILLNIFASAARPPRAKHIRSNNCMRTNTKRSYDKHVSYFNNLLYSLPILQVVSTFSRVQVISFVIHIQRTPGGTHRLTGGLAKFRDEMHHVK